MAANTSKSKHLKVGLVIDDSLDRPDGVQQYTLAVGEWLRSQGHEVHYLAGHTTRTDIPNIHSLSRNLSVRFNGNRLTIPLPTSRRKLRAFLEAEQFDVLHVQMPYSPLMAGRIISAAGPGTVVFGTFHILPYSPLVRFGSRLLGLWTRRVSRRFDEVVAVSTAAQDFANKTFHLDTSVLPNTIVYDHFNKAKAWPQYKDKVVTLLFLGRLVPRKGCMLLLRAVNILNQEKDLPAFRVVVCGKGPLRDELEAYAQMNDLQDCVTFTGFVSEEDKPRYYASADIAVFPSSGGESFGIVLVEAMATGRTAVLAGDNPGYRSVLVDRPELLFDPHSAEALAQLLRTYLLQPELQAEAATWGGQYAQRFDADLVGSELVRRYSKRLQDRQRM